MTTGELKDAPKLPWLLRPPSGIVSAYTEHCALLDTRPRSIAAHSINSVEFTTVSCHADLGHREPQTRLCSLFTSGFVSLLFARVQLTPQWCKRPVWKAKLKKRLQAMSERGLQNTVNFAGLMFEGEFIYRHRNDIFIAACCLGRLPLLFYPPQDDLFFCNGNIENRAYCKLG